jgi:hypothetical protein
MAITAQGQPHRPCSNQPAEALSDVGRRLTFNFLLKFAVRYKTKV